MFPFFFKGKQIKKNVIIIYIKKKNFKSGCFWEHPDHNVAPPLLETVKSTELLWMGCAAPTSIVECLFAQVKSKPDLVVLFRYWSLNDVKFVI